MRTIEIQISGEPEEATEIVISGPRRSGKSILAQVIGRALKEYGAEVTFLNLDAPEGVRNRIAKEAARQGLDGVCADQPFTIIMR